MDALWVTTIESRGLEAERPSGGRSRQNLLSRIQPVESYRSGLPRDGCTAIVGVRLSISATVIWNQVPMPCQAAAIPQADARSPAAAVGGDITGQPARR